MSETNLTFPFVDLRSRLRPDRWERLVQDDRQPRSVADRESIIKEVAAWLSRAQNATGGEGIVQFYHLQTGWSAACPETSGAAMTTLLLLAEKYSEGDAIERALRLEPSLTTRHPSPSDQNPAAILSGNVSVEAWAILGWIGLYERTLNERFKTAAIEAGQRLVEFRKGENRVMAFALPHKSIIAWALWRLIRLWPSESLRVAADAYGDSVVACVTPEGYLDGCISAGGADPALIQITQALQGLFESGILAGQRRWISAAQRGARRLLELYREKSTLAGRYGPGWRPDHSFNCMAGCAQTAFLWLRLYQFGLPEKYFDAAVRLTRFIASTVDTTKPDPGVRGGIRAGYPLWVDYHPLAYSALAAKSALDAFLLEDKLTGARMPIRQLRLKKPAPSRNS